MTEKDTEINIFEIFYILYKSKIVILLCTILFMISGYLYYNVKPTKVYSEYSIFPIFTNEEIKYNAFNTLQSMQISSTYLKELFIEQINSYDDISNALISLNIIRRDDYNSKNEFENALNNFSLKFKIEEKILNQNFDESDVKLMYIDTFDNIDRKQINMLFDYIILSANENVRLNLINEFNIKIEALITNNQYSKQDLEVSINNLREEYLFNIERKIAFLKEQAQMARHLEINSIQNEQSNEYSITNIVSGEVKRTELDDQYYLIGYEAIEKEIEILENRSGTDLYIEDIHAYTSSLKSLNQDQRFERAKTHFNLTPIHKKDEFRAIRLDTDYYLKIKVISELSKYIAISTAIGIFISSIFVILSYYSNKKTYF